MNTGMTTECKEVVHCYSYIVLILGCFFCLVSDCGAGLLHTDAQKVWDAVVMDSGFITLFIKGKKIRLKKFISL